MPGKPKTDERVTKRRVTMTNRTIVDEMDDNGNTHTKITDTTAVDFVRPDLLDVYVADAKRRWETVVVSDEPDAGPAGYDGPTFVPFGTFHRVLKADGTVARTEWHEFEHELAGSYFPATEDDDGEDAPQHPVTGVRARVIMEG